MRNSLATGLAAGLAAVRDLAAGGSCIAAGNLMAGWCRSTGRGARGVLNWLTLAAAAAVDNLCSARRAALADLVTLADRLAVADLTTL